MRSYLVLPKRLERWGPLGGTFLAWLTLALLRPSIDIELFKDISNIYTVFFSVASGFIATSLSILFTVQDKDFIRSLKTSNAFYEIVDYHWKALGWSVFAILSAFIPIIMRQSLIGQKLDTPYNYKLLLCIATGVGAFLAVLRVTYLFGYTLRLDRPNR